MGDRVEINGVNTWYDERGAGDTIVGDVTPSSAREAGAMRQTGLRLLDRPSRSYIDADPPQFALESWDCAFGAMMSAHRISDFILTPAAPDGR
jgi:hypothetical protein